MTATVTMTGTVKGVEMTVTLSGNGTEAPMLAAEARKYFDSQNEKKVEPIVKNQFTANAEQYAKNTAFLCEVINDGYVPLYPRKNIIALTASELEQELAQAEKWNATRKAVNTFTSDGVFDKPVIVCYEGNRIDCWSISTIIQVVNTALSHGHVDLQLSR